MKGAQIVIECLIEQGVEVLFGYPGGTIIDIFDELYKAKDRITHILTSHEQGASHAADGYARASGKVGVVLATSGPGATNLVTGIANAYMDSIPMVAITGNVPLALLGRDSFQEVDITGITMPITKHNFMVKDIKDLAPIMREAFYIAASGRPGPVLVDIPKNIQQELCEYKKTKPKIIVSPTFDKTQEGLKKAIEIIKNSNKPLAYVGGGVVMSKAEKELLAFCESQDIPMASSMMALGCVPYTHPLHMGMIGMHGRAGVAKALFECDTIIAIGARFSDRVATNRLLFGKGKNIIHIDIDAAELDKNVKTTAAIEGDAKAVLTHLTTALKPKPRKDWAKNCANLKAAYPFKKISDPLCPRNVLECMRKLSTDSQIVATDVGQHQMWTAQSYGFSKPGTFVTSGGLGAMGFGLGAAIGACFASKKPVYLVTGDGSFHMNLHEMATAVRYKLPIKVILLNNKALGMVRQWQTLFYDRHHAGTILDDLPTNFGKLADAFGAKYAKITKNQDIEKTLKPLLSSKDTCIIECEVQPEGIVLPMVPAGKSSDEIIIEYK